MNKKGILAVVVLLLILASVVAVGYYYFIADKCGGGIKSISGIQNKDQCLKPVELNKNENQFLDNENNNKNQQKNETANWKVYKNEEYGFEFKYPDDYSFEVKKYKLNDWRYVLTSPEGNSLFINLEDNFLKSDDFEKFIFDESKKYCDADGKDGSIYCLNENKKIKFINKNGITGYEFYLNETTENNTGEKYIRIRGPIFALDFFSLNNLNIGGAFFNENDTFLEKEVIKKIISTFKFIK